MFGPKIKVDKSLYERAREVARIAGYSTVDEFVGHILERELQAIEGEGDESEAEIAERLKGLGYL